MISKDDFEEVRKHLPFQHGGNQDSGQRRAPTGATKCDGCGSHMVVVRTSRCQRYYRCRKGVLGHIRSCACRTLVRVID